MKYVTRLKTYLLFISFFLSALTKANNCLADPNGDHVPNLLGTWSGENKTYSEKKGYANWNKTVVISEQKGRIFKGQFTYSDGTKHFFGVIYPDNISFTWVSLNSNGYNQGRIHSEDTLSACYTESGADATVGCAKLIRKNQ